MSFKIMQSARMHDWFSAPPLQKKWRGFWRTTILHVLQFYLLQNTRLVEMSDKQDSVELTVSESGAEKEKQVKNAGQSHLSERNERKNSVTEQF